MFFLRNGLTKDHLFTVLCLLVGSIPLTFPKQTHAHHHFYAGTQGLSMKTTVFNVEGLKCQTCVERLRQGLVNLDSKVEVTFQPSQVKLEGSWTIDELHDYLAPLKMPYKLKSVVKDFNLINKITQYYPIYGIVSVIAGIVISLQWKRSKFDCLLAVRQYMGTFMVTFSVFKIVNLKSFTALFREYDILAKRLPSYSWAYPFIEFSLGIAHLVNYCPPMTNFLTTILMLVSTIGVLQALLQKRQLSCACLGGTLFKLPLSFVALFENLSMMMMALVCLFSLH